MSPADASGAGQAIEAKPPSKTKPKPTKAKDKSPSKPPKAEAKQPPKPKPTPAAGDPRRLAIDALVRIDTSGAYANLLVPSLLADSGLSTRDRAFVTELVYGTTRLRRRIDHVVDRFLKHDPPPAARAALRIGAHQMLHLATPPHAAVSATVSAAPKRHRGLVNAVLRKVAALADNADDPDKASQADKADDPDDLDKADGPARIEYPSAAVELSCPDWMLERLSADLGPAPARAAMEAMNRPATVHRRDDGYVQDRSSGLVADAVPAGPGDLVLDLCAAPGGKATALAGRGARVIACDLRRGRAGLITANRDRLGLDGLHVVNGDAAQPPFRPGTFDAVLVDAPCSGLGVLRRRPDARWRIAEHQIAELAKLQGRILAAAAALVRPGGHLVYSVCTLTRAEAIGPLSSLPDGFTALDSPGGPWQHLDQAAWLLLPDEHHDGAAIARWQRCGPASA